MGSPYFFSHEIEVLRVDDGDHSDSKVEGAIHVVLWDIADLLEKVKNRQNWPAASFEYYIDVPGQYSGDVFNKASTSDMSQTLDYAITINQPLQRREVILVGLEELLADRHPELGHCRSHFITSDVEQKLSREAVAIGMKAQRR